MKSIFPTLITTLGLALASFPGIAQYPSKPIRLIVPFSAGGASDTAARTLAQTLAKSLGQPVIIDNRPGAGGSLAIQAVMTSPADGYTLLWTVASMVAIPLLQKSPPFQSLAELTPVAGVGRLTYCMFVPSTLPVKSVGEFITYARANPDKLSYATGSLGEFMVTAQFIKSAGIGLVQVPYKGGAQAMPDLIAGRVQLNFGPYAGGSQHARDGKLRMLATLLPQRTQAAPEVPTLAESGVRLPSSPTWQAIFAPPKTPQPVVDRLARDIAMALQDAALRTQFERQAMQIDSSSPAVLAATVLEDMESWRHFIRENNIPQE